MNSENVKVLNDDNGFVIIGIAGKEFISQEPVKMVNGRFKVKDLEKAIFGCVI